MVRQEAMAYWLSETHTRVPAANWAVRACAQGADKAVPYKYDPVPHKADPVPYKADPVPYKTDPVPYKSDPVPMYVGF